MRTARLATALAAVAAVATNCAAAPAGARPRRDRAGDLREGEIKLLPAGKGSHKPFGRHRLDWRWNFGEQNTNMAD
ncbi:hypothetical protein [Paractinoplanes lichenicola]|uniref:Uncharacterized protein n=1 Tax=Paractinoplanes lichenicola TaxID=2802976 RepID=A0ABS1VFT5_9ACTN|nr:hypothetical protein [Actinoplanes lichenicola]MBL7253549.1 hypothetical protein [Actinoplanes lichenicola]